MTTSTPTPTTPSTTTPSALVDAPETQRERRTERLLGELRGAADDIETEARALLDQAKRLRDEATRIAREADASRGRAKREELLAVLASLVSAPPTSRAGEARRS